MNIMNIQKTKLTYSHISDLVVVAVGSVTMASIAVLIELQHYLGIFKRYHQIWGTDVIISFCLEFL